MSFELSSLVESLQRGIATLPPAAIAVVLLAGPTAALVGYRMIGYRMMSAARRMQTRNEIEAVPLWVCHDCRSVNEWRVSRCYHCGVNRNVAGEIELIVDQRSTSPTFFEVPAGSPFAALGASASRVSSEGPGIPVMADASVASDAVAVGPGRRAETASRSGLAETDSPGESSSGLAETDSPGGSWSAAEAGAVVEASGLASALERRT